MPRVLLLVCDGGASDCVGPLASLTAALATALAAERHTRRPAHLLGSLWPHVFSCLFPILYCHADQEDCGYSAVTRFTFGRSADTFIQSSYSGWMRVLGRFRWTRFPSVAVMEIRPETSQVHQEAKWLISTQQRDVPARHQSDSTGTDVHISTDINLQLQFSAGLRFHELKLISRY